MMQEVLHFDEKEQFRNFFKDDGLEKFEKRFSILKVFLNVKSHLTLLEFLVLLKKQNIDIDIDIVLDTLRLMCKYGFARKHCFKNGNVRYEYLHLGQHHDHMICVKCDKIFEFKNKEFEELQVKIASIHKFHILQHKMELYGVCYNCMEKGKKFLYLSDAPQGKKLIVTDYKGSKKTILRLASIGLRIGDEVEIILNSGRGQLIIAVGCKRLIISRDLAKKLFIKMKIYNK